MNTPSVQAFIDSAAKDPKLAKKLKEITAESLSSSAVKVAALAKEAGFNISPDEWLAHPKAAELTEEHLSSVAGGQGEDFRALKQGEDFRALKQGEDWRA